MNTVTRNLEPSTRLSRKKLSPKQIWGIVFVSPWIVYMLVFLIYPIFSAFQNSFLDINLLQPEKARFIGFENWVTELTDGLFWKSLVNIIYNQAIFIPLTFLIALIIALLLNEIHFASSLFRTVYFLPIITSLTVAMLVFNNLASAGGPIQMFLMQTGLLHTPFYWKTSNLGAMPTLALFNSWKWFGIQMVIFLGGLASIDPQVHEAASIDGAGWWKKLFSITLPLLKPQIVFVLTMNVINGLQMFTEVYISFDLQGGSYHQALTPVLYLYSKGFDKMTMGSASTVGLLLALVIFILTTIQSKIMNRHGEEAM